MPIIHAAKGVLVVASACDKMPASCPGRYRKVALLRMKESGTTPSMISLRDKKVAEIINVRRKCFSGTTARCEASRAVAELIEEMEKAGA